MLEYPSKTGTDNVKNDLDNLIRWAQRLVPELEQQLANLGVDNFSSAYNERLEGMTTLSGAGKQKTTSDAIAEHLLDTNNPHKVTLHQLGYEPPQATEEEDEGSTILTLGGLMIQLKPIVIAAGTCTAAGNVYRRTASAGDWQREFSKLYVAFTVITSGSTNWLSRHRYADEQSAGELVLYSPTESASGCTATIIGIGRE